MSESNNNNEQNYKTSLERRTYQKHYYKKRMEKQKQLESQIKLSGGDILAQSMNEIIDSDDDYKIPAIEQRLSGYVQKENPIRKPNIDRSNNIIDTKPKEIVEIKPQINKEQIVNFKLKKAVSWISQNVQKDGEAYLEELGDQLGYNIETIHGLYEVLKVAETYFNQIF
jgi:hypothetical protein